MVLVLVLSNRLSCRLSKAPRLQCQICKFLWVLNYRSFTTAGVTFQRSVCSRCPRDVAPVGRACRTCPRATTTTAAAETTGGQQRSTKQQSQMDSSADGGAWLTFRGEVRGGGAEVRGEGMDWFWNGFELW